MFCVAGNHLMGCVLVNNLANLGLIIGTAATFERGSRYNKGLYGLTFEIFRLTDGSHDETTMELVQWLVCDGMYLCDGGEC